MDEALLTKAELAERLLLGIFASRERIPIAEAVAQAKQQGIGRKTLTEARKRVGATEIHNGPYPGFWQAPSKREDSSNA